MKRKLGTSCPGSINEGACHSFSAVVWPIDVHERETARNICLTIRKGRILSDLFVKETFVQV